VPGSAKPILRKHCLTPAELVLIVGMSRVWIWRQVKRRRLPFLVRKYHSPRYGKVRRTFYPPKTIETLMEVSLQHAWKTTQRQLERFAGPRAH